jgi:site-specific DNA recombinase
LDEPVRDSAIRTMSCRWLNRCPFPAEYTRTHHLQHLRAVYLRETDVMPSLDEWFAGVFRPDRLPATIVQLTAAQADEPVPELEKLPEQIAETDRQLAAYRAALDGDGDPAVIGGWITEARKLATRARLDTLTSPVRLTREEITGLVNTITDIVSLLANADPADKPKLYGQLGPRLTYNPGQRTVLGL